MCYSIYVSTTSPENLDEAVFKHLQFNGGFEPEPNHEPLMPLLGHPRRWYLTRAEYGGCSCHFRHADYDLSFGPPEDWCPEDEDNNLATSEAYHFFRQVLEQGYELDLINAWSNETPMYQVTSLDVFLDSVPEESFRFFENHHFKFHR